MRAETRERLDGINREFYSAQSAAFDATRDHPWPGWERTLAVAPAWPQDGRVLDLGCGNGRFARFLAASGVDPFEYVGLDNLMMELALDPHQFDTIVLGNLDGDLVSDLCAGLVGGLGLVPGANIGEKFAVFEAVHGTAPDIAGQGIANPIALILSAELMLLHVGERDAAQRLRAAVDQLLTDGSVLTGDLGGTATTEQMTEALLEAL